MNKYLVTLPLLAASVPGMAQDETTAETEVLVGVPESLIIVEGLISTFTTETYSSRTIAVDQNQRLENSLRTVPGL
ncbi:MAG: hypothetical protein AAGM33_05205, partial [Pseudomonadota bacterium]